MRSRKRWAEMGEGKEQRKRSKPEPARMHRISVNQAPVPFYLLLILAPARQVQGGPPAPPVDRRRLRDRDPGEAGRRPSQVHLGGVHLQLGAGGAAEREAQEEPAVRPPARQQGAHAQAWQLARCMDE